MRKITSILKYRVKQDYKDLLYEQLNMSIDCADSIRWYIVAMVICNKFEHTAVIFCIHLVERWHSIPSQSFQMSLTRCSGDVN